MQIRIHFAIMTNLPWHLDIMGNMHDVWNKTYNGSKSFVVIYDTCVDDTHIGLVGKIIKEDSCCLDVNQSLDRIHGTIVSSVISASHAEYPSDNNYYTKVGDVIAVSGVAPKSKIIAYSNTGLVKINPVSKIQEIYKKICEVNSGKECAYPIKEDFGSIIINFSSGSKHSQWDVLLEDVCHADNVLIIAAMGNNHSHLDSSGRSTVIPASLSEKPGCNKVILKVAGTKKYSTHTKLEKFKNLSYGAEHTDIYVPAEEIAALIPEGKATYAQGTSESAPLVAGTLALMSACKPTASGQLLRHYLLEYSSKYNDLDNVPLLNISNVINNFCAHHIINTYLFEQQKKKKVFSIHEELFKFLPKSDFRVQIICVIGECKNTCGEEVIKPTDCQYLSEFTNISINDLIGVVGTKIDPKDIGDVICIA